MSSVIVLTSLPATPDNEPIIMDGLYRPSSGHTAPPRSPAGAAEAAGDVTATVGGPQRAPHRRGEATPGGAARRDGRGAGARDGRAGRGGVGRGPQRGSGHPPLGIPPPGGRSRSIRPVGAPPSCPTGRTAEPRADATHPLLPQDGPSAFPYSARSFRGKTGLLPGQGRADRTHAEGRRALRAPPPLVVDLRSYPCPRYEVSASPRGASRPHVASS